MKIDVSGAFETILGTKLTHTIVSVFFTFITYLLFIDRMLLMINLGVSWILIFTFITWFLIIEIVILVVRGIRRINYRLIDNRYSIEQRKKEVQIALENIWTTVDSLPIEERKDLMQFIKTENKPILKRDTHYMGNSLYNSQWVHKSRYYGKDVFTEKLEVSGNGGSVEELEFKYTPDYQYILKEDIYNALRYSYKEYKKISHFDDQLEIDDIGGNKY